MTKVLRLASPLFSDTHILPLCVSPFCDCLPHPGVFHLCPINPVCSLLYLPVRLRNLCQAFQRSILVSMFFDPRLAYQPYFSLLCCFSVYQPSFLDKRLILLYQYLVLSRACGSYLQSAIISYEEKQLNSSKIKERGIMILYRVSYIQCLRLL